MWKSLSFSCFRWYLLVWNCIIIFPTELIKHDVGTMQTLFFIYLVFLHVSTLLSLFKRTEVVSPLGQTNPYSIGEVE